MLKNDLDAYITAHRGRVCVYVRDLQTDEVLYARGADKSVLSASTIKLAVMGRLMEEVSAGCRCLSDAVTVTPAMLTGGDGVLKELQPGHTFTLEELMTLMIIVSDNTATNILIDLLGMETVNAFIARQGLLGTVLGRRMMDGEARRQGRDNFITAAAMGTILARIYGGTYVDAAASRLMLAILKRQQQSGRLQLYLPEEVTVAHKCGDLDFVENDGGIVYAPSRSYVIVVLVSEAESNKEGREIIGHISKIVYDALQ